MNTALSAARVEHVMLGTADYDATLAWWTEKLGFTVEAEWTVPDFPGVRLAYLAKNGFRIEIVGKPERFQPRRTPNSLSDHLIDSGFGHLAFEVDDVDAAMAELSAKGVPAFVPATSFPDAGRRVAFVKDDQGNVIEFAADLPGKEA
ncbi:MAG: VOC family protein [Pseudomonadota bacterium]